MEVLCLLVTICLSLFLIGESFPFGGPPASCLDLFPHHKTKAKDSASVPYTVKVDIDPPVYTTGKEFQITLSSDSGDEAFEGFVVRVTRTKGDKERLIGTFTKYDKVTTSGKYWYNTTADPNCVSHKFNKKKTSITVTWKAPDVYEGQLSVGVSFVKHYDTFWLLPEAIIIEADQDKDDVTSALETSSLEPPPDLNEMCGKDHGCFLYPHGCSGSDCNFAVAYKMADEYLEITMLAEGTDYISLGISEDRRMGHDETFSCLKTPDGSIAIQHGYNPAYYHDRHQMAGTSDLKASYIDDHIYCSFKRNHDIGLIEVKEPKPRSGGSLSFKELQFNLTDTSYYLFIAWGTVRPGVESIGKHRELPAVSSKKVDFNDVSITWGSTIPLLYRIHAGLALLAWLCLAGIAIVTMRHYKKALPMKVLNVPLWFQIHKVLTISVLVVTVIAVVMIFIAVGKWTKYGTLHGLAGLLVTGLATVQLILGLLRPSPKAPKRPLFNKVHRVIGLLSVLLAVFTCCLAFSVPLMYKPLRSKALGVIISWLVMTILIDVILTVLEKMKNKDTTPKSPIVKATTSTDADSPEAKRLTDVSINADAPPPSPLESKVQDPVASFRVERIIYVFFLVMNVCFYIGALYILTL